MKKILLIVDPRRPDFYQYLQGMPNAQFALLWFVDKKEREKTTGNFHFAEEHFWSDFSTPEALLSKIRPDVLVFFEIIDQRQIALVIAANHLGFRTVYLDHGAAGDAETALYRSSENTGRYKLQKIKNVVARSAAAFPDMLAVKRFYLASRKYVQRSSKRKFDRIPFEMFKYKPLKALHHNIFPERVPNHCIVFNRVNGAEFKIHTGADEKQMRFTGIPFFDAYYSGQQHTADHIVYIDHPYFEEETIGWTKEHHKLIARTLTRFCTDAKQKLVIKLHPRSEKRLWDSYDLENEFVSIIQSGQPVDLYLTAKLILSYSSSLMTAFLSAKLNCVLLGWHPDPRIFGADYSKYELCHLSFSVDELFTNFQFWVNTNKALNARDYEKFIHQFNEPFDGKATERVFSCIAGR